MHFTSRVLDCFTIIVFFIGLPVITSYVTANIRTTTTTTAFLLDKTQNGLHSAATTTLEGQRVVKQQQQQPVNRLLSPAVQCIACTGLVGLFEQWHVYHSKTCTPETMHEFCNMLPNIPFAIGCNEVVRIFGKNITDLIIAGESADVICTAMTFCNVTSTSLSVNIGDGTPKCHLFPLTESSTTLAPRLAMYRTAMWLYIRSLNFTNPNFVRTGYNNKWSQVDLPMSPHQQNFDICTIPLISTVCNYIHDIFSKHEPLLDIDRDRYSIYKTVRGYAWRGRDCDDALSVVRPGRESVLQDFLFDSNCNGIRGVQWGADSTACSTLPQTYEELFCANSSARGIAMLGDSVTAHFHIPWQFLNATAVTSAILENLTQIVENEFDFPHFGFGTGWQKQGEEGMVGPIDSLYLRLRERNLCNHRDYQNIGVNGANSFSAENDANTLSRTHNGDDKPLIVFFAYVGNDVCNSWFDTLDHDTHVLQFEQNLNATLLKLDKVLPMGSHVIVMDLADARFLYDNMNNRTHPLGALRNDVKTKDFYDYLNCLDTSPCRGWLTSNDTLRNFTLQRVNELNRGIAETVLANQQTLGLHPNYNLYHLPDPIGDVFKMWLAAGGQLWQLIEPVDGFHPNQFCHSIISQVLWDKLLMMGSNETDIVGPINPFNDQIRQIFGDQGGH